MKKIMIFSVLGMMIMVSFATGFQGDMFPINDEPTAAKPLKTGYIDITPLEAWDMMNTTDDGIQILIDVRRLNEFLAERIILPDESDWIRWFPYEFSSGPGPIKNEGFLLQLFMNLYKDKEIILFCRSGRRSGLAAQILVDNGFSGIAYNVLGGILEWKDVGLPTT